MTTKLAPVRPCDNGCGGYVRVRGRIKLCDDCCSKCACGNRKSSDRPRCRDCASKAAEQRSGLGVIEWVPNGHGIVVAKR